MTSTARKRTTGLILLAGAASLAVVAGILLSSSLTSAGNGQITVNSTSDSPNATPGDDTCDTVDDGCTLRAAIDVANSTPGTSTIAFEIPGGAGPRTIAPQSPLPAFTESVIIDGYTQPGAQPNTLGPKQGTNAVLTIEIDGSNAGPDANGLVLSGGNNIVRGLVINNFDGSGILLFKGEENTINTPNSVEGNFLGTDVTGEEARGNGVGVTIQGSWWNFIGDMAPAQGNVISGNGVGILLEGDSMDNFVRNSIIGAARDGVTPLGNESHGVLLRDGALCNTIGSEQRPGENIIAYNGGAGVAMDGDTGINNYVDPNEMHSNAGLGIDLGNDGVTPNDPDDLDSGPNDLQNFPVITSATVFEDLGVVAIEGFLDSNPNKFMNMFLFLNDECDPSGHGEGFEFVHKQIFNTGADGDHEFFANFNLDASPGQFITATVSSPESTSEFSECAPLVSSEQQFTQGDTNCDGEVGATDALATLQHVAGLDPNQQPGCPEIGGAVPAGEASVFGDVDCDDDVDATDALKILQFVAALPFNQNEPCTGIGEPLTPSEGFGSTARR